MKFHIVCIASKVCMAGLIFNLDQFMGSIADFLLCSKPVMIPDYKLQRRPGNRQTKLYQLINHCRAGAHDGISTAPVYFYRAVAFRNGAACKNNIGHITAHFPGIFGLQYPRIGNADDVGRIIKFMHCRA